MRRGFTIIELLVASLLLGLLTTILTMMFNQSSIAWRTGTAGVADLDDLRDNMAELREEADNAFLWNGKVRRLTGLWKSDGELADRACDAPDSDVYSADNNRNQANLLRVRESTLATGQYPWKNSTSYHQVLVGQGEGSGQGDTYIVNVMSGGPHNDITDYEAIWSFPDDFE